jgi:hypothetical protein
MTKIYTDKFLFTPAHVDVSHFFELAHKKLADTGLKMEASAHVFLGNEVLIRSRGCHSALRSWLL